MKNVIFVSLILVASLCAAFSMKTWPFEGFAKKSQNVTLTPIIKKPAPTPKPKLFLREAVLQQRTEIETCYDEYLRREPKRASGSISVTWKVGEKGNVVEPEIATSTLNDEGLKKCVLTKISQMTFEPDTFATNAQISYKFNFKARTRSAINFQ